MGGTREKRGRWGGGKKKEKRTRKKCSDRGQKRHINIWHINFFSRHSPPAGPGDKPGLSQGETGLPLCKISRKPRFVLTWAKSPIANR